MAGDPDDAVLLAEQTQRLNSLFGEADNSARWKHQIPRARVGSYFSANFPAARASAPPNCSRNFRSWYCSPPRHSAQQSEVDVVADVIRPGDDAVIQRASAIIFLARVPIDAAPSAFLAERDEAIDQGASRSGAAGLRRDEEVLEIADRLEAPGVGVEDVVGETDRLALGPARKQATQRLIRRQDAAPDAFGDGVRDRAVESRAIAAPQREPSAVVVSLCRPDHPSCRIGDGTPLSQRVFAK